MRLRTVVLGLLGTLGLGGLAWYGKRRWDARQRFAPQIVEPPVSGGVAGAVRYQGGGMRGRMRGVVDTSPGAKHTMQETALSMMGLAPARNGAARVHATARSAADVLLLPPQSVDQVERAAQVASAVIDHGVTVAQDTGQRAAATVQEISKVAFW